MKVLLIGHACAPGLGSEPGNMWAFASGLARHHQVWVIAHPQHRSRVESALAAAPEPSLQFIWVEPNSPLDPWRPGRGESGIRFHYILWLRSAYQVARRLEAKIGFDVAHHVSWGTVGAAPPVWKLKTPTIWGPLGGGQTTPSAFLGYFGADAGKERLRNLYTNVLAYSPSLRRAVHSASAVLATNHETASLLTRAGATNVRLFLDCGLLGEPEAHVNLSGSSSGTCTFLWAGRLESRKGFPLALDALARTSASVRVLVAGQGPMREAWESETKRRGLDGVVNFLGSVPYEKMPELFRGSDAFLFTSLRDSFGSVVLEAMSYGLPVVTLNHQGVGAFVPEQAGIKVPVATPEKTADSLAKAIEKLSSCSGCRRTMANAALEHARAQTWANRVLRMSDLYSEVVSAHSRI